nr:hypothetical protein [Streptomyces typhae]
MHPEAHLYAHHARAAELQRTAGTRKPRRGPLRSQVGWTMVELGLRLVSSSERARPSGGLVARRSCPTA